MLQYSLSVFFLKSFDNLWILLIYIIFILKEKHGSFSYSLLLVHHFEITTWKFASWQFIMFPSVHLSLFHYRNWWHFEVVVVDKDLYSPQAPNLYYYIKHLRIERSIFCHGNFLLYTFYLSIRRIIFIFDWSNVYDRVHWSPLSLHFFPLYTIISIILFFLFSNIVHIW
jgi:hypothetical protein